jgi:threonine-phosphate decarboxylase
MIQGHGDDTYNYPGIRSNFSSNIYPHADLSALKAHLCKNIGVIGNYPEPDAHSLEELIARKYGVSAANVLVTNGATDAIYLIAQTFSKNTCTYYETGYLPTFCEYEDACRMFGLKNRAERESQASGSTILWLCNPNNPTGDVYSTEEIALYARDYAFVVIDQSYEEYTLAPIMPHQEAAGSENILQLHSLTKTFAIPGLRIGYVIASEHLIALLRENTRPWAVNALAIEAAKWLIENNVQMMSDLRSYLSETQRLRGMLNQIEGIIAANTQTHFILSKITFSTAAQLKVYLARKHHLLIRDASNICGLSAHHFRVSTQRPDENERLVEGIKEFKQYSF